MPSQQTSPSTAPTAAAPLARLSRVLQKLPLLSGLDPLHSRLARRREEVTMESFYAL
jgi:putative hemolysin